MKLPQEPWAVNEIKVAAAKSLVPYDLTDHYDSNITREEMAVLLENAIVTAGNYANMDAYMIDNGVGYTTGNFADCIGRDESIDRLFKLGIISGRTDVMFEPDGAVSRQEAAAMITRVAYLFMYVGTNYRLNTADSSSVAPWASFYVRWVIDKGIMSADENNRFNPDGTVSVQQAITAVSRLFDLITYWES